MNGPLVSIVVLNMNGKGYLRGCLGAIRENTEYENYEVIVVDNASTDGSQEMVKEEFPGVELIENEENRGFSGGNNIGIEESNGDWVLLLNNDTEPQEGWLEELVRLGESSSDIGIVGCKMVYPDGKLQHGGQVVNMRHVSENITYYNQHRIPEDPERERDVQAIVGAGMMVRREVFEDVGLLDEGYDPIYREETDFCLRARKAGWRIRYTPDGVIVHHEGETMDLVGWKFYAWRKNTLRFILIHFPLRWLLFWAGFQVLWIGDSILRKEFFNLLKAYRDILTDLPQILARREEVGFWA